MEPDVVEIAPPSASSSKTRKQKQAVNPEASDVERYEIQNSGGSALNDNADKKNKGKAVDVSSNSYDKQATDTAIDVSGPVNKIESHPGTPLGSHNILDPDSLIYEDDYEYYDQSPDEATDADEYSMFQDLLDSKDIPTDVELSIPWFQNSTNKEAAKSGGSSSSHANNGKKSGVTAVNANGSPSLSPWPQMLTSTSQPWSVVSHHSDGSKSVDSALPQNSQTPDMVMGGPPFGTVLPVPPTPPNYHASASSRPRVEEVISAKDSSRVQKNMEDFLGKFLFFKRFDTVEDFSDHHYASRGSSSKQHAKSWVKRIQEEWKILENDLPDMIFVRAYESRMDLLRAVIIGAEGTPYHDGLFFFDIHFPETYPNMPPKVHYHAGGLRINPNLYNCGKVCLSLLGTWSGNHREKWIPNVSTMLQVLVSIQALILNQNPYFNEPGFESGIGTPEGESISRAYNENTFILSLKTMVYNMRRPPKHFEDFAYGHFFSCCHDIMKACKAYKDGAVVGSLVNGCVQAVEDDRVRGSERFRADVESFMKMLVDEFVLLGVKGMDEATAGNSDSNNNDDAETEKNNKVKPKRDRESR
ncbi:PREDICTED: putative ubiquitin-conjugating enzyme E2 38 isoform X2 [Tarenaya hassleriana]|uniref:putative ubiquitin-conjugating enzyme E2 38 isoform X2 n=1 Tax=Tarenaya hassleriana TaxID=28532 RepID=UPI00053C2451|nr:PREDICTED: putative ubiquitin-conjugating enzyme E2 38 isoform X2 [Tarenaya hassleriana]